MQRHSSNRSASKVFSIMNTNYKWEEKEKENKIINIQVSHKILSSFLHNNMWDFSRLRGLEGEDGDEGEGEGEAANTKQLSLHVRRIG